MTDGVSQYRDRQAVPGTQHEEHGKPLRINLDMVKRIHPGSLRGQCFTELTQPAAERHFSSLLVEFQHILTNYVTSYGFQFSCSTTPLQALICAA